MVRGGVALSECSDGYVVKVSVSCSTVGDECGG